MEQVNKEGYYDNIRERQTKQVRDILTENLPLLRRLSLVQLYLAISA